MTVKQINPTSDRAEAVATDLCADVKQAIADHDTDLAGYALVTWDMRGNTRTFFSADQGPVGKALVPTFAKENLYSAILATGIFVGVQKLYFE